MTRRTVFDTERQRNKQRLRNATVDESADAMDAHGRGKQDRREERRKSGQGEPQGRDDRSSQRGTTSTEQRGEGKEETQRVEQGYTERHRNALKTNPRTKRGKENAPKLHKKIWEAGDDQLAKEIANKIVPTKMQQEQEEKHCRLIREAQEDLEQKRQEAGDASENERKAVQLLTKASAELEHAERESQKYSRRRKRKVGSQNSCTEHGPSNWTVFSRS